jgi:hypothetical protein
MDIGNGDNTMIKEVKSHLSRAERRKAREAKKEEITSELSEQSSKKYDQ